MPVKGGGGGGGSGVRDVVAGGASYVLKLKDGLTGQLEKIQKRVQAFGSFMGRVGRGVAGAGGAGVAAGGALLGPIGALLKGAGERAVSLDKLATKLGVSVEKMSAFAHAAELAGVDLEGLTGDFENFAERVSQAANGTGEAAETFKKLGLDARALRLLDPIDQMKMLADAMQKVGNETDRLGMLSSLGGDQFQWLNEFLKGGSAGIDAAMEKAPKITTEDAKNAREFARAWTEGLRSLQAAVLPLLQYLTPAARAVAAFVRENAGLVSVAAGAGVALTSLGVAGTGVGLALGLAGKAVALVGGTLGFLLTPLGLLTGTLVTLGALWVTQTEGGKRFAADLGAAFGRLAATAVETWGAVSAAMKKGDFALAGRVALQGLQVAWVETMLFLTRKWNDFKDVFLDGWADIGSGIRIILWDALAWYVRVSKKILGPLLRATGNADIIPTDEEIEKVRTKLRDDELRDARERKEKARGDRRKGEEGLAWDLERAIWELLKLTQQAKKPFMEEELEKHKKAMDPARFVDAVKGGFFSIGGAARSLSIGDRVAVQSLEKLGVIADVAKEELPGIKLGVWDLHDIWRIK